MPVPAIAARRLQFVAGPETHVWYACADHRPHLDLAWPDSLFYAYAGEDAHAVDPDDELACDWCREEGQ